MRRRRGVAIGLAALVAVGAVTAGAAADDRGDASSSGTASATATTGSTTVDLAIDPASTPTVEAAPTPPTATEASPAAATPPAAAEAAPTAAWEPGPAAYGVAVTDDVPLPMPDGRVLRAAIHHPTDPTTGQPAPGPFPVLLSLTPYGKSVANPIDRYLVQRGYLGIAVDVAGTGGSDGVSQLFGPIEAADSVRIIDWAASLPTSSGVVGMVGGSYLAIDQLFAAAAVGPGSPLKALFPIAAAVDPYRDLFVSGGLVNHESSLGLLAGYGGVRTITPLVERQADPLDAIRLAVEHALQLLPFEVQVALDVLLEGERRFDGAWWRERAPERILTDIVANDVAVFLVGGLYDVFQRGTPLLYSGLQNAWAGRPVTAPMEPGQPVSPNYQLLFGPWHHGNQGEGLDLRRLQLQWFDHWLKGVDTGVTDTTTPIQVVEPGGGTYQAASYPIETATPRRLHLAPGGRLTEAAPTPGNPDTVFFTALSELCTRATQQWSAGMLPESVCGEREWMAGPFPGEVAYTSEPMTEPTTLAGPIGVTLHARSTTAETMWVVQVEDVAPDGTVRTLSGGALLGSMRAVDEARSWPSPGGGWLLARHPLTRASQQLVTPGQRTRYDIEVRPVFATLGPGHRLRVTVGTGDFPHLLPPLLAAPLLLGGIYTLDHDPAAPSWIDVPVVGG